MDLATNFVELKKEFVKEYRGNAHIQEIVPKTSTDGLPIDPNHLDFLHLFALKNPIYHNHYEQNIANIECIVYEGDINQYWINSLKHATSHQPFYPTWLVSAYIAALTVKSLGYTEIIDIGSGDGRIAYCGKFLGLNTYGIEIDESLVDLQHAISNQTKVDFNGMCNDATEFDYSTLSLSKPAIFTGGLPQMGDLLASNIIMKFHSLMLNDVCIVLAGSYSKKQFSIEQSEGGWGKIIHRHRLKVLDTVVLPTVWTYDQPIDTPYFFTKIS